MGAGGMGSRRVRRLVMSRLVMCSFGMGGLMMCWFIMCTFMMYTLVMCRPGMSSLRMGSVAMHGFGVRNVVMPGRVVFDGVGLNRGVRAALIDRVVLVPVISGFLLMRALGFCCLDTTIARFRLLSGGWSRVNSTLAIKADAIVDTSVADHCTVNVGIVNDGRIDVPNRCIIPKGVALPSTA